MALLCLAPQEKCFQYWPEKGCWIYGSVRVAMEDFTVLVDYTIRKFYIQYVSKRCFRVIPKKITEKDNGHIQKRHASL